MIIEGIYKPIPENNYSLDLDFLIGKCLRVKTENRITINNILKLLIMQDTKTSAKLTT